VRQCRILPWICRSSGPPETPLTREDLIKFAKKQMVAMQKIKSKCTGEIIIVSSTL
uniref:Uncharacterized protein n=1 Tax=Cyprinus carpio TaxID=7962 RepID=A0A8C1T361_CYPCA